jgi:hypothetical protein
MRAREGFQRRADCTVSLEDDSTGRPARVFAILEVTWITKRSAARWASSDVTGGLFDLQRLAPVGAIRGTERFVVIRSIRLIRVFQLFQVRLCDRRTVGAATLTSETNCNESLHAHLSLATKSREEMTSAVVEGGQASQKKGDGMPEIDRITADLLRVHGRPLALRAGSLWCGISPNEEGSAVILSSSASQRTFV